MFHKRNKTNENPEHARAERIRDMIIKEYGEDTPYLIATPEGISMMGKNYEILGLIELIKRDGAAKLNAYETADGQDVHEMGGGIPPELKALLDKLSGGKGKVVELKLSDILGAMPDCGDPDCKGHEAERRGKKDER